jgi:NADPH2:quinone reductase
MAVMKALVVHALSGDLSGIGLARVPVPRRAPGQVLIRVRTAALNHPDLLMTRGTYQLKPSLPFVPGMELVGEVVEADGDGGGRAGIAIGERVVATTRLGAFAEWIAVDAGKVRRVPDGMDDAEAASVGAAYLTAYVALVRLAALRPGESVLVHGATGGVGLAAVDLAQAFGARVIATSRSADKLAVVAREHAVAAALTVPGFREPVKALTGGGADIVFDPVGGDVFDESTRCIAFGGRMLVVGFTSGRIASVATNLPLIKGFSLHGVRAGEYGRQHPERGREDADAVWSLAAAGRIHPRVHARYPLAEWRAAFAAMARADLIGKLVIDVAGGG